MEMVDIHWDRDIDRREIQQLSNADAITAFFARLGYNTDARIEHTPATLRIDAQGVIRPIEAIERIANHDDALQVMLFVVKSVTVSHTRELARQFRNRYGNFLLVLTTPDYDRLDFVLLERYNPVQKSKPGSMKLQEARIRPRVLTVSRRDPTRQHLRVLRRFTYTEGDPFAQFDKLRSAYDVAEWSEEFFNNRALFSDYYLKERLRETPAWGEDPKPAYQDLVGVYAGPVKDLRDKPVSEARDKLFEPVFKKLGFDFEPVRAAGSGHTEPDYLLRAPGNGKRPLALALVYSWDRSLDMKDNERDGDSPEEVPGAVVISLLEKNLAPWAVVTNGKLWRLYSQHTHSRATNYYEIDLEEVMAQGTPSTSDPAESFRYFWLLFRSGAFIQHDILIDGEARKASFLDQLLLGSEAYARELGERLKERTFVDIFPHLAKGFIEHMRAREGEHADLTQERLDQVFQGTLTLLYRLLFLLYAESRDLLPVREERGYFEVSLTRLKDEIARAAGPLDDQRDMALENAHDSTSCALYERFMNLCRIVENGDEGVNVPVYNGGLFMTTPDDSDDTPEAQNARFLQQYKVPDLHFAKALDRLARDEDPKRLDLVPIDFKSLGVRQLGSIYEGLLEFKLRIAPTKMAIVKGKKSEQIIPYTEAAKTKSRILTHKKADGGGERVLPRGAVYLENDKGERKATGSYYTPDHIVKYIVEHTVGPVLQAKFEALRPKLRQAEKLRKAFDKKQEGLKSAGLRPEASAKADLIGRELVDEIIGARVVDPAMGSGHFLVETVDFITDKTLDFLNAFPWNPVSAHLERMRGDIRREMERQKITINENKLTDVNLLKRHILKQCIYGVDLNPMAVELAKVSLWLDCFTLGAPLSFLDHHIKCGNSLIGVTVKEVREASESGQGMLWGTQWEGFKLATEAMRHVGALSDVTSDQARESRREFKKAASGISPFKLMLDVYASQWFGNEPYWHKAAKGDKSRKRELIRPAIDFLNSMNFGAWLSDPHNPGVLTDAGERTIAETALRAAREKRFFHWELEFPEVFFGPRQGSATAIERKPEAGFDAVVGNPPYVRQEGLGEDKPFFEANHAPVYAGIADIYVYFYHRGLTLCRQNGRFGMITSNKYLRAGYGEKLRAFLAQFAIQQIIDFRDLPVFPDAAAYPLVLIARHAPSGENHQVQTHTVADMAEANEIATAMRRCASPQVITSLKSSGWVLQNPDVLRLLDKIRNAGRPLGEVVDGKFYRGVLTGFNEAFVIDEAKRAELIARDPRSDEIIKPFLRGRDIKRWRVQWAGLYLIFTRRGINIDQYPAIKEHLSLFKERLTPGVQGGRKPGNYKWYEIQDAVDYYEEFEKPKISYPDISENGCYALDTSGAFLTNTAYFIPSAHLALVGLLNSKLTEFYYRHLSAQVRGGYVRAFSTYIGALPVPDLASSSAKQLATLVESITDRGEAPEDVEAEINAATYKVFDLKMNEIILIDSRCTQKKRE